MVSPNLGEHPSHYVVRDLVTELTRQGGVQQNRSTGPTVGRILARTRMPLGLRTRGRRSAPIVVPMMGAQFGLLYSAAVSGAVVPYCWDVWEPQWDLWVRRLRPLRPPVVFTTASQSARFLARALPASRVIHLPEATEVARHDPQRPLVARTIGVLELGRRYQMWHDIVRAAVPEDAPRCHVYERPGRRLVFPDESALRRGLSNTVVSACFPSSMTHPQRAGSVQTLTHRYLESMASGCLLVGHAPPELVRLMGFNPVVEVDWRAPAEQILDILHAPHRWQPHVDRALERLREVGDWSMRVRAIRAALDVDGA
ncbi:hypothetical protein [Streptacidiphilus sp. EB129]|uniref:hypothetical protein n=1 Tax=Streptacidiphilus sp. EB129 TaxID=3156262 RepID=UPI003513DBD2